MPTFSERVRTERKRLDAEARRLHEDAPWGVAREQQLAETERRIREIQEQRLRRQQKAADVMGYAATIASAMPVRPQEWRYAKDGLSRSLRVMYGWGIASERCVTGYEKGWEFSISGDSRHIVDVPVYGNKDTVLTQEGSIAFMVGTDLLKVYERPEQITGYESEQLTRPPYHEMHQPNPPGPDKLDVLESQLVCFAAKNRLDPMLFE